MKPLLINRRALPENRLKRAFGVTKGVHRRLPAVGLFLRLAARCWMRSATSLRTQSRCPLEEQSVQAIGYAINISMCASWPPPTRT